jgi:hypothetical protein
MAMLLRRCRCPCDATPSSAASARSAMARNRHPLFGRGRIVDANSSQIAPFTTETVIRRRRYSKREEATEETGSRGGGDGCQGPPESRPGHEEGLQTCVLEPIEPAGLIVAPHRRPLLSARTPQRRSIPYRSAITVVSTTGRHTTAAARFEPPSISNSPYRPAA